jgi:hypothetical protein
MRHRLKLVKPPPADKSRGVDGRVGAGQIASPVGLEDSSPHSTDT